MDSTRPVIFLERYRLAVCEECGLAVLSKEVLGHLRAQHRGIDVSRRHKIAEAVSSWPSVIQDQAGLRGFSFPPPTISYIPQLAAPKTDGLKCHKCPYIARQLQKIQGHRRDSHGWINSRSAGQTGCKRKRESGETDSELPWQRTPFAKSIGALATYILKAVRPLAFHWELVDPCKAPR